MFLNTRYLYNNISKGEIDTLSYNILDNLRISRSNFGKVVGNLNRPLALSLYATSVKGIVIRYRGRSTENRRDNNS